MRFVAVLVLVAGMACAGAAKAAAIAPVQRIVTLSPGLAELALDAGAGRKLVGTVAYSDFPAAARRLPRIGDAFHIDSERLLALHPDLALAWATGTPPAVIARLRSLGIRVAVVRVTSLADIADALESIGRLAGTMPVATPVAAHFRQRLAALRRQFARRTPVSVFYEISAQPLYTVNGEHTISQVLGLCGGRNIFADLSELAPAVSLESVLARDPQAIITGADAGNGGPRLAAWRHWPDLAAVKADNLFSVDPDLMARATPRILDGASQVCAALDAARSHLGLPLDRPQSMSRNRGLRQSTSSPRS